MKFNKMIFVFALWMVSCSSQTDTSGNTEEVKNDIKKDTVVLQKTELVRLPAFENYAASLTPGTKVEVYKLSWPGDDKICDDYELSDGPLKAMVFRLEDSKKIIMIREEGAFCQGDSEFDNTYLMNDDENMIYTFEMDLYGPNRYTYFDSLARAMVSIEIPGEGEEHYSPRINFIKEPYGLNTAFQRDYIKNHEQRIAARIKMLKATSFKEEEKKAEAEKTVQLLEEELAREKGFTSGYVFRKAGLGETTLVNAIDIPVRNAPGARAQQVGTVSYYSPDIKVIEVREDWYNITYYDFSLKKEMKGWIPGSALVLGIFPVQ